MVGKKILLSNGAYLYNNGAQPLSKDFIDSYLSQLERTNNIHPYLTIESIASFLHNESKKLNYSLPKHSFSICAKRLLQLTKVQNSSVNGTSQSLKNLKSSINSVNNYCAITTHIAESEFKKTSNKLIAIAESINEGEFPQSITSTGKDRFILFEATKIIRETLGYFLSSTTTATIISLLVGKVKSRQWVENNITLEKKEEILLKIKKSFQCPALLETSKNVSTLQNKPTTINKLSDSEVFAQIKSIIKQAENQELLTFLEMRFSEAQNDWGIF